MKNDILEQIQKLQKNASDYVLITMIGVRGSAPQDIGAKAIVTSQGLLGGTVGGGKVEARAISKAIQIIEQSEKQNPELVTWNLQKDIGMTCGGEVQFLFEHFVAKTWPIIIFGAGHVSQALCKVLSTLECQVTVIDSRQEWLSRIQYSNIQTICLEKPEEFVKEMNDKNFVVSMTKGHAFDVPVLIEIAKKNLKLPYLGVIGSKTKANAIRKDLIENKISDQFIEDLIIPIGLPIGSNDTAEIAISIVGQLLEVRDGIRTN